MSLAALVEIGAVQTHQVIEEFWSRIGPIAESDAVSTIDDVDHARTARIRPSAVGDLAS